MKPVPVPGVDSIESTLRPRDVLVSGLAYVAVTAMMGRHVLASLSAEIASDAGDPLLNAAILAWNAMTVPWTAAWFQFPIFHPTPDALVFSEHLLGGSLIASPVYWATGNAITAYNLTLLLSYPLCALSMWALVWRLTRSVPAAFLGGLAFGFAPYRTSQLPHIQMLLAFWAPLALLGLHAYAEARGAVREGGRAGPRRRWWLALFAVCWVLQGASNGYLLVYFSVVVALWAVWFLAAERRWREFAAVAAAAALAALPLAPILYRYLVSQRALGLERNLGEIASFGADIAAPLCAPPTLTFWGWLRVACRPEGELFAGVTLMALCIVGVWQWHARPPSGTVPAANGTAARWTRPVAVAVALAYIAIAVSVLVVGAWRLDFGLLRVSASSVDKPATVACLLLVTALLLSRRFRSMFPRGSTPSFYLVTALVCWVLSWGPFPRLFGAEALYQAPFAWLLQVPGVGSLRVPARFWMLTVLCLSVYMGLAVARMLRDRSRPTALALVSLFAGGLLVDGWTTIPVAPVPTLTTDPAALRGRTVLVLPLGERERDVAAVYHGVTAGWRLVNGFSGYEPVSYEALRTLSAQGPDELLGALAAAGPMQIIDAGGAVRAAAGRTAPAAVAVDAGARLRPQRAAASCSSASAGLAIDGAIDTAWVCGTQMTDHEFTLDLGEPRSISGVVHAIGNAGAFFPRQLVIETSLDGASWSEAWTGSPAAAVAAAAMAAPTETRALLPFAPRAARHIRLRQIGRHEINYWAIAEVEAVESSKSDVRSVR